MIPMNVREILMVETAPYNNVQRRPLRFHADSMRSIEDFINTTKFGTATTPSAINKLATGLLQQSAEPEGVSEIANGWGTRRFHFMMAVEESLALAPGTKRVHYISGYTDHSVSLDAFTTRAIDLPSELVFFFTNVIQVTETTTTDMFGKQIVRATPMDATNLLTGAYDPVNRNVQFSTRVQDTLTYASTARWVGQGGFDNQFMDPAMQNVMQQFDPAYADVVNRTSYAPQPEPVFRGVEAAMCFATEKIKPASADTNIPTIYLRKAFDNVGAIRQTYESGSHPGSAENEDIYVEAAQAVREEPLVAHPVFGAIMRDEGFAFSGSLSWADMKRMFGEHIRDVLTLFPYVEARRGTSATTEFGWMPTDSQSWDVIDYPTLYCSSLAAMMPAAMTYRMLESFRFIADNHGHPELGIMPGQWAVAVTDAVPFIKGYDCNRAAEQMRSDMITNILPSMLGNNPNAVMVSGAINLFLDSQFKISVDGSAPIPYTMPNINPSAYSPLLNRSQQEVYKLSVDLFNLVDAVTTKGNF